MSWSAEGCDALSAPFQGVRRDTSLGFGLFWLARYGCLDGVARLLESPYSRTIPGTPSCSQPQKPRRREAETQLCKRGTRWKSVEMCTRSEEINETILRQKLQDVKDFFFVLPPSVCSSDSIWGIQQFLDSEVFWKERWPRPYLGLKQV